MSLQKLFGKTIDDIAKMWGKDILVEGDAAVGDVKASKTFYAAATALKTGTLATVALAAGSNDYPEGYHTGNVGGLDTVDADLVAGNIADGVTIFGVLGNLVAGAAAHDAQSNTGGRQVTTSFTSKYLQETVPGSGDLDVRIANVTVVAGSVIEAGALYAYDKVETASTIKGQIIIDGVQVYESTYLSATIGNNSMRLFGYREGMGSGTRTSILRLHNYNGSSKWSRTFLEYLFVGSVKVA